MQQNKSTPQKMKGALIFVLTSFVLASALLIQPLGLTAGDTEQQKKAETTEPQALSDNNTDTTVVSSYAYTFDPAQYQLNEPEFYNRSSQDFAPAETSGTTKAEEINGDADPQNEDIRLPEDVNPLDDVDPQDLEPPVKPQGLDYTDVAYTLYVKAGSLYMRAGPSTDSTVLTKLSFGDTVLCIGENEAWMKVQHEGRLGFLKTEFTSKDMVFEPVNETVYVDAGTLRLREGPSTNEDILATLSKNDRLARTGIGNGWSQVKTSSGKTGYVSSEYLTKTAPVIRTTTSGNSGSSSSSKPSSSSGTVYSGNAGKIVDLAYQALGVRYVYGSHSMSGMDCSGLTYWAYRQVGISVPRSSGSYYNAGSGVSYSNMRAGDVIAWDTRTRDGRTSISHVGIYVGNGNMIHASSRLGRVVVQNVREYQSWGCKIVTIRRFIRN
ncbi:MAG: SH3 domain-containing protein [Ruminococcaceae bacterium]|nr:SH3 domain-containing protein [Oscillospiraceae bacterium]